MDEARITELWNRAVDDTGDALYPKIIARFAEFIAAEEREACYGALEIVLLMAKNGNYSGQEEAVQKCLFALQERSNVQIEGRAAFGASRSNAWLEPKYATTDCFPYK